MTDWGILKQAAERLLDLLASEHPLGHQKSKALRYILPSRTRTIELLFEKNEWSPANIWVLAEHLNTAARGGIKHKLSPASKL